jgi:fructose-specific phosphotransferase system IIC component
MGIIIPLGVACLVLVFAIPFAARRGKLSVPIYALLALAVGVVAFGAGTLAGVRSVRGTPFGIVVSILFFLLVATAVGCFLSMLFYRQPPVSQEPTKASKESEPSSGGPPR